MPAGAPELPELSPPDPRFGRALHVPESRGDLLVLEDDRGAIALPFHQVERVRAWSGRNMPLEFERLREATSLTVRTTTLDAQDARLGLQYLTRGLTWAPSYAIELTDGERARLVAKATVLNESEQLEGALLELVTGYPNLRFSAVWDPIAMRESLDVFLQALARSGVGGPTAALATQGALSNLVLSRQITLPIGGWEQAAGSAVGDLFFYPIEDVTLARGERGLFTMFELDVPYRHVYQWEVPDTIEARNTGRDEGEPEVEEVWHALRLVNESALPWTTAPAMTLEGGRLLGQDTLTYTAAGAANSVRITRAVDVQGEASEVEVARNPQQQVYRGRYDRVTIEGVLRATNHKAEAVDLEIEKVLKGVVTENPDEATITTTAEGLRGVNPSQRLAWSLQVDSGETVEVRYTYTHYAR